MAHGDLATCVALVKTVVPELRGVKTTEWTRGEDIKGIGDPPLKPGTAIADGWDKDGKYPSNSSGNHAMVYMRPDPDVPGNVIVVDQYGPRYKDGKEIRPGQPAKERSISPSELKGYSVIRRR